MAWRHSGRKPRVKFATESARPSQKRFRPEDHLLEREERYRAVFENSLNGIIVSRSDGTILSASPEACRIMRSSEEDICRRGYGGIMDDSEGRVTEALRLRNATGSFRGELTFIRGDGTCFPVEVASRAFRDSTDMEEYVTVFTDISERKLRERQLEEITRRERQRAEEAEASKRRLEEINRELESFSYSISHDLRTPLRAIEGFSGMILHDFGVAMDAELKRRFDVIRENVRRMNRLIDDLLEISRLGQRIICKKPVDMERLFRQTWMELLPAYPGRNVWLQVKKVPPASGDRMLLKQLITNLLTNALKYTSDREQGLVEIGSDLQNGQIVYYVRDNGVGFNMRYKDKLFRIFQRLHSPSRFEGTGIGLAIVQRIVNLHGGRVWAEAKVGEGAAFYFSLPE